MFRPEYTLEKIQALNNANMSLHLGIEITALGADYICGRMPVDERTKQPFGLLHGGASVVLAETLGSIAANCCINHATHSCVGLEINANHIRPVTQGYVTGKATALHIGGSTQIWEIKISNEAGKLVCVSRITMAVLEKKQAERS